MLAEFTAEFSLTQALQSLVFAQIPLHEEPLLAQRKRGAEEEIYFSFLVLFVGNVLYNLGNRK